MPSKRKKSLLDAFLATPGNDTLKKAAKLLENTLPEKSSIVVDQTLDQSSNQSKNISSDITVDKLTTQSSELSYDQAINQPIDISVDQSIDQSIDKPSDRKNLSQKNNPIILRETEALLYYALRLNTPCFTTVRRIAQKLDKSEHTLRKCIKRLNIMGIIKYKRAHLRGQQGIKIFTYQKFIKILGNTNKIKITLKDLPVKEIPIETYSDNILNGQLTDQLTNHSSEQLTSQLVDHSLYSSSSSNIKTTTELRNVFLSDPELGYWRDINLKPQQIQKWMDEIQISIEDVIESLKHCRFDLIDNGLLESKPVRDPLSWVYKRLKQYGYYHAPKGYISFEDKALKRAKERLKKKQERARELAAIREAELEAERQIEFEKMMNDTECELYQACYEKLNNIEKKLKNKGFVRCMRKAFDKLVEESPLETH